MKKILAVMLVVLMAAAVFTGCANQAVQDAVEQVEEIAENIETEAAAELTEAEEKVEEAADEAKAEEAAAQDDSWEKIQAKGKFVMGLDDSFPPMGFVEDGELVGFDVDMAKAVAEHMGIEVELQPIDWSAKEMELDAGNIDVIWNGYTITDERKEKVLMSAPYMQNTQVIVVTIDSEIQTLADLAGEKIAVQDGSSAQGAIDANEELKNSIGEQIDFKDNVMALNDVASGQVAALAVDSVVAEYYLTKKPGEYRILDETLAPEEYGIGFRKGEQAFHDQLWAAFEEMKTDGTAAEISNQWFGRDVTA